MFTVPFTFPNTSSIDSTHDTHLKWTNVIDRSFTSATPTVVQCLTGQQTADESGVLVGCEDGTIYVFRRQTSSSVVPPLQCERRKRRAKSPQPLSPRGRTSPVGLSFSRARVVSGVTTEMVEAPKNYVDFEPEADKLKDILQGRNPKEKHPGSDTASLSGTSNAPSIAESVPGPKRSSPPPPRSTLALDVDSVSRRWSFPVQPTLGDQPTCSQPYRLLYHIIPDFAGAQHAVRVISLLGGNSHFAILHQHGNLSIYSMKDGACAASASSVADKSHELAQTTWNWCSLDTVFLQEETLLYATAALESRTSNSTRDNDTALPEHSQTVLFRMTAHPEGIRLERMGRYESDGPTKGVGWYRDLDGLSTMFNINNEGHFMLQEVFHHHRIPSLQGSTSHTPVSDNMSSLPLPKSIKAMVSRSSEHVDAAVVANPKSDILEVGEPRDMGLLLLDCALTGLRTLHVQDTLYGIAWAQSELTVFTCHNDAFNLLVRSPVSHIEDAEWVDTDTFTLSFADRVEVYKIRALNEDGDLVISSETTDNIRYHPEFVQTMHVGEHDAAVFGTPFEYVLTKRDPEGRRVLVSHRNQPSDQTSVSLWQSSSAGPTASVTQTATLPIEFEWLTQGYSDGRLRQFSLDHAISAEMSTTTPAKPKVSHGSLSGNLTCLNIIQNARTRENYVIGGSDDGSIALWHLSTLELCARWTAFTTPLIRVLDFDQADSSLHGCVLCVSSDGTIAVIVVDGFQFLYLIPGSPFPLTRVSVQGTSLLLTYGNQVARLWDLQAKEFHRSMSIAKAEESLQDGHWVTIPLDRNVSRAHCEWTPISPSYTGADAVATLALSMEQFLSNAMAITKTISTRKDEVRNILRTFSRLKLLLSMLLTPGLSADMDSICLGSLQLPPSNVCMGLASPETTTLYSIERPQDIWCISGAVSASRLVAIVHVLRALSLFEESAEAANTIIAFYTTSLPIYVGPTYEAPSLERLAQMWFQATAELRQTIRVVFDAVLSRLSDQEVIALSDKWQSYVPSAQPESERENTRTALALFLCGFIASERFNLLSVNTLTEVSKSVATCFHDDQSTHRVLAIDLCSKGFAVWQQYVDTLDILRSLFMLATTTKKSSISIHNMGAQARMAVLSIAAQNTALFMSTLCLDVLDPFSLEHRRSVMQILAFLIRKRPLILQPHLARLMEAVVKSLDPNSKGDRDAILGAATEIIGNVVKTYPTVDFHMATQRLAVGTNEGAVVMYDLKTAIRLYVLEGHRRQLTGLNFSPDGRRLVTVSLADQHVMVWKVGSGFASFFMPGLPPNQGNGGSEPFKTFPFSLGYAGEIRDSLDVVSFEWTTDRNVKVKIGDSLLTFST